MTCRPDTAENPRVGQPLRSQQLQQRRWYEWEWGAKGLLCPRSPRGSEVALKALFRVRFSPGLCAREKEW